MTTATQTGKPSIEFKGLDDWIEVFRAGTHTDSKGNTHSFATADLDQMVANVALGKPPAVIGHPKHEDPAYAWAELRRDGDSLYAKFADINPQFEEGVRSGAYRNRSVAVYQDKTHGWRVRHIGWLGAAPPALDGLKPLAFSADEGDVIEFMAADGGCDAMYRLIFAVESIGGLMRSVREWVIERSDVATADRVLPTYSIESIQQCASSARQALADADDDSNPAFSRSNPQPEGGLMPFTQEDIDRAREEAKREAEAAAEARFAAQGKDLAELRAERINDKVSTQVNEWIAKGLVLPADEPGVRAFMVHLESTEAREFTFAAPDKTEVKQKPSDWFMSFMSARTPLVRLGRDGRLDDPVQADVSDDPSVISQKAMAFIAEQAQKGIEVSVPDAVAKFSKTAA